MAKIILGILLAASCVVTTNAAQAHGGHVQHRHCLHWFHKKCTMH
jgi:hypothetical protein